MPLPTTTVNWAINDVAETDPQEGGTVNNKETPTPSLVMTGALSTKPLTRPHLNYMLNSHGQWIDYLREGEVGDTKLMPEATTESEMNIRFGNTWSDLGTTSFTTVSPAGTQVLRLFEKTA